MDVDPVRKRLFISRDPRGFTIAGDAGLARSPTARCTSSTSRTRALHGPDSASSWSPAGHTTTCVNACDTIWTAGPYANPDPTPARRPADLRDRRDATRPTRSPCPSRSTPTTSTARAATSTTSRSTARGVAWVSGEGGLRGYWTSGEHINPLTGQRRDGHRLRADPLRRRRHARVRDAVALHAQPGTTGAKRAKRCQAASRATSCSGHRGERRLGLRDRRAASSPTTSPDTLDGQGFAPETGADARHEGARHLDARAPGGLDRLRVRALLRLARRRPDRQRLLRPGRALPRRQRPDATSARSATSSTPTRNTWAAYWHKGYVFVADFGRGVDVLKFTATPPPLRRSARPPSAVQDAALRFDRSVFGGLCPLPL